MNLWWKGKVWPYTINATSTHDTKRGEDVRARLNVLSEIPQAVAATGDYFGAGSTRIKRK